MFFGDAPSNPDELNDYMDKVVSELRDAYTQGGIKINLNPDKIVSFLTYGLYSNEILDGIDHNYAQIAQYIDQLNTDLRQAVLSGQNQSGNPYDIDRWESFALDVASDIKALTQYSMDASYIENIPSSAAMAAKATADTITNPLKWPWWMWGVVAVGGAFVFRPYVEGAVAALKFKRHKPSEAV